MGSDLSPLRDGNSVRKVSVESVDGVRVIEEKI